MGSQRLPRLLGAEALEAAVEAGKLTAGVQQALLAAGPGRVRFRVDLQPQRVPRLAVGRAGLIAAAIGHHDRDLVIIGVNAFLHRTNPRISRAYIAAPARPRNAPG